MYPNKLPQHIIRKGSSLGTSVHRDADSELLLMELPWRFQGQVQNAKFHIPFLLFLGKKGNGIPKSELLPLESP